MGKNEKNKKKYEAPVVVPLGELAAAMGVMTCKPGTGANGDCTTGVTAGGDCKAGGTAGGACHCGNNTGPGNACQAGL